MAKFDFKGLEDIEKRLLRREASTAKAVQEMVKAGADVIAKVQQDTVRTMFKGKRSFGDLANSIKKTRVNSQPSRTYADVYPHGKNRRGERNATVGFVQQYGRSNMAANPWMTEANAKAADEAQKAMLDAWMRCQNE